MSTVQLAGAVGGVNARLGLVAGILYLKVAFSYLYLFSSPFSGESGNISYVLYASVEIGKLFVTCFGFTSAEGM